MNDRDDCVIREKVAHNLFFSDDTRKGFEKFYSIVIASRLEHDKIVLKKMESSGDAVLLDYGCGNGEHAIHLKELGVKRVMGIDISDVGILNAESDVQKKGLQDIEFCVMDAMNMEFDSSTFDVVCGNGILHHLDTEKTAAEIARVLKSDGIAVFNEPLGTNPFINLFRNLTPRYRTKDEHPFVKKDFEILSNYFTEVQVNYYYFTSLLAILFRKRKGFQGILAKLMKLDEVLFKRIPYIRKYAWESLIVMRK